MSLRNYKTIQSYEQAEKILRDRNGRGLKLAHNTWLIRDREGDPAIQYHSTNIVTFLPDGVKVLTSGGWFTTTTKERFGKLTHGVSVGQEKFEWYLYTTKGKYEWRDGLRVDRGGYVFDPDGVQLAPCDISPIAQYLTT